MTMTMAMISPSPEANLASRLALRGRTEGCGGSATQMGKATSVLGFLHRENKQGQSRAPGGVGPSQEGRWRGQGLGRARHPPGCPLAALWAPLGLTEASGMLIFYIIFLGFIGHFNYWKNLKYKNRRKQELATGCTELISQSKYDQKCMEVYVKHGKVTQNMHGASRNYRYVWDVSTSPSLIPARPRVGK